MIHTRHIRASWQTWIDSSNTKTVRALCGKRTTDKFCGIPGVTDQPLLIATPTGYRSGWCHACCKEMSWRIPSWAQNDLQYTSQHVIAAYDEAFGIIEQVSKLTA